MKVVLMPGLDGTGNLFSGIIAAFPATFDPIVVRYPEDLVLSYPELMEFVRAACPTITPFLLIAESFSSPLAIAYAATKPENLVGLVLCAGFAESPLQGWQAVVASKLAPCLFRIPPVGFVVKLWLLGRSVDSSLLTMVQRTIAHVKPQVLAARLRAVLTCDVRLELAQITVPILYLQASHDRLVEPSCLMAFEQANPKIAVQTLDGPHLLLQREPHKAARVIVKFVEEHGLVTL